MKTFTILLGVLTYNAVVFGYMDKIISKGKWEIDNIEKCPDAEKYPIDLNFRKKRLNRTHYVMYGHINLPEDVTEDRYGVTLESCKKVDGGCRLIQVLKDDSICRFIRKYAEDILMEILRIIGYTYCSVPKGNHKFDEFLFNVDDLPEEGMIGTFENTLYITNAITSEKVGCLTAGTTFKVKDD